MSVFTFYVGIVSTNRFFWEREPGTYAEGYADMTTTDWNDDWADKASCNRATPDELFVRGAAQNRAKQLCSGCPVRTECLAEALDNQIEWGVWGGMTERERRALLRKRPNVTSWKRLLETARQEHMVAVQASVASA